MDHNSSTYEIYLVIPSDQSRLTVSVRMKETYDQLLAHDMGPSWTETKQILDLKQPMNCLFICDTFQGEAFNHLQKLGSRILGPLCFLSCLKDGTNLPRRPRPILSLNMRHVVVTFSNIPPANKKKLKEMVLLMGGECPNSLTQSCTHLVSGCVGSEKYVTAVRLKLPIVTPDWIISCWTEIQKDVTDVRHATDSFYDSFKCKAFYGLVVTASQLNIEERQRIQALVTDNGGKYSGAMKLQETTHLVLEAPNGNKFDYACSWKVKCVTKEWVFDCAAAQTYLSEDHYELQPDSKVRQNKASTPKKEERPLVAPNCSILLPSGSMDCVNETCLSNVSFILAPAKSAKGISCNSGSESYLDKCRLFICGLDNKEENDLENLICKAGGKVCKQLQSNVSHIICNSISSLPKIPVKLRSTVHIVSREWIINCIKAESHLPEANYVLTGKKNKLRKIDSSSSVSDKVDESSEQFRPESFSLPEMNNSSKTYLEKNDNEMSCRKLSKDKNDLEDKENLLKSTENLTTEFVKPLDVEVTEKTSTCEPKLADKASRDDNNINLVPIFSDINFMVEDPNSEDKSLLIDMLESCGGTVHNAEKSIPNNCVWIVPVIEFGKSSAPANATVRTNFWVHMCIEQQSLQPINSNRLYQPILVPSANVQPLKDCVLAFSQFNSSEKSCLTYLANSLGAECSEYFVRVNKKKGLLANTHLILASPEGTKYDAACKWGIPAVHKEWLYYAAEQNKHPVEELFSINKPLPQLQSEQSSFRPDGLSNVSVDITDNVFLIEPNREEAGETMDEGVTMKSNNININNSSSLRSMPNMAVSSGVEDWKPAFDVSEAIEMLKSSSSFSAAGNKKKRSMSLEETANYHFSAARRNFGIDSPAPRGTTTSLIAKPLLGVVLCVSRKLASQQKRLHSITEKLGGKVLWTYDDSCTHFVYQGKGNDHFGLKDFRQAQAKSKHIVSPEWLLACEESVSRLNENDFPYNYNPRLSLSSQVTSQKVNNISNSVADNCLEKSEVRSPTKNQTQVSVNKAESKTSCKSFSDDRTNENINASFTANVDSSKLMEVNKQLQELMTVRKNSLTSNSNQRQTSENSRFQFEQLKLVRPTNTEPETQASQNVPIMWEDPTEKKELEWLARNPAPLHETESQNLEKKEETEDICSLPTQKATEKKVFLLSGLSDESRIKCTRIIENLSCEVTESYNIEVTHLVCEQPSRNGKTLSSLAAGVWILHPSFLQVSEEMSRFVPEDDFEWGSEATKSKVQNLPTKLQNIAIAPHIWRTRIANTGKKAFYNWEVKLFVPEQKLSAYMCILKAGGAKIVENFTPGFAVNKFAFFEGQFDVDFTELAAQGVTCVKPEYFFVFLAECRPPNCSLFTVKESHMSVDSSNKRRLQTVRTVLKKNRSD